MALVRTFPEMKRALLTLTLICLLVVPTIKAQDLDHFVNTGQVFMDCRERAARAATFYAWVSWYTMMTVYVSTLDDCSSGN